MAATVLLAIALLALLLLLPYYLMFMSRRARLSAPVPGPKPLPFLGNALEFGNDAPEILKNITRLWKQYGFLFRVWLGPFLYIFVADAKHAEVFLTSNTNIKKSLNYGFLQPWLGTGLLTSTGNKWKSRRKILTPTFHFKILEDFMDIFNSNGNIFVEKLKKLVGGPEFDIQKYVCLCALDSICEAAMGVQMNMQNNGNSEYVSAIIRFGDILMKRSIRPWLFPDFIFDMSKLGKEQKACVEILHGTSNKVIASRKKEYLQSQNEDSNKVKENEFGQKRRLAFLDLLLQYKNDGVNLSDEDIREEVDTFMFEGHDTVSSGISFCLWCLANNPKHQEQVYEELQGIFGKSDRDASVEDLQDMRYLECVIKESQRLFPSVALFLRELDEDVKLDGFHLVAGTTIVILPYYMHRNPEYFPEPEKFDPERFSADQAQGRHPYAYVPFSAGPRNCIGQRFAMMEMKSLLSKVVRNYKLLPGTKDLSLSSELVLRSVGGVHIRIENR